MENLPLDDFFPFIKEQVYRVPVVKNGQPGFFEGRFEDALEEFPEDVDEITYRFYEGSTQPADFSERVTEGIYTVISNYSIQPGPLALVYGSNRLVLQSTTGVLANGEPLSLAGEFINYLEPVTFPVEGGTITVRLLPPQSRTARAIPCRLLSTNPVSLGYAFPNFELKLALEYPQSGPWVIRSQHMTNNQPLLMVTGNPVSKNNVKMNRAREKVDEQRRLFTAFKPGLEDMAAVEGHYYFSKPSGPVPPGQGFRRSIPAASQQTKVAASQQTEVASLPQAEVAEPTKRRRLDEVDGGTRRRRRRKSTSKARLARGR